MGDGLLVITGEPSGDVAAAKVVREIAQGARARGERPPNVIAVGGDALRAAGAEVVWDIATLSAMGTTEIASRAFALVGASLRARQAIMARRPRAALLVGFSEINGRLYPMLRSRGIRSVFYGLPQVWAWRPRRARTAIADVLCAMLPFEAPFWSAFGHDVRFVGHPALEATRAPRSLLRDSLGLPPRAPCIALLPGSRSHEIVRMLDPMLASFRAYRDAEPAVDARVIVAPSLDAKTRAYVVTQAAAAHVPVAVVSAGATAGSLLPAFDASLVTSGTATLEASLAGAHPVIAYRASRTTELAARALLGNTHIGLPNLILGRRAYVELVGHEATPKNLTHALQETLSRKAALDAVMETVRSAFGAHTDPSRRVAQVIEEELGCASHAHPSLPR